MEALRKYLNSLTTAEQLEFVARCGSSIGYLRKAISIEQRIGESLAIAIERESGRQVTVEELRPDVDWAVIRNTAAA